ncbi:MAG: single-stranded DNA-binding protein [Thermoprotei archaeon]|nr:MAG: single-stranded DNA-binding protein [Thermoprotei archaeon]RLF02730.1 MAG: single-stranded DNA-binding protein [Thermoprotei archaeon]
MAEERLVKVRELNPTSRNFDIRVKILEVGSERVVTSRRDGTEHRVAEALVGDETGVVRMTLWDKNINVIREKEGSTVIIRNGYIGVFRNSMRLNIGRNGSVEDSPEEIEEVNRENNISEQTVPDTRPRFYRPPRRGRFRRR